ncbi:MAG: alpha/beta hydrolase [Anaerolineae bacterium]|nr:alpha/beta hydrolase [Anaerolineae bacterium]
MKIEYASYVDSDGKRQSLLLDLYLPRWDTVPNPPLLVYIPGGGWLTGSRQECPGAMIARQGFALACIDYRHTDVAHFPTQIQDVKAAIRWLRSSAGQYHFDGDHIGAWGTSAGGHLSALLGTSQGVPELEGTSGVQGVSSAVQAVADWYGPTDFNRLPLAFNEDVYLPVPDEFWAKYNERPYYGITLAVTLFMGGAVWKHQDRVAQANPITWVDPSDPPFFVFHGEPDNVVPVNQSDMLVGSLQANGVPVEYYRPPDRGHSWADAGSAEFSPTLVNMVLDFFTRYLKPQPPAK